MLADCYDCRLIDCVRGFSPTLQAVVAMAAEDEQDQKSPLNRLREAAFEALVNDLEASAVCFAENLLRRLKGSTCDGVDLVNRVAYKLYSRGFREQRYDPGRG